ncbi:hypothetical protein MtrunA17_Chr2g0293181 [Medicago truncatula]|uniref:Uncharacterized protein n=1 Tax=Medicago truncatula TaxID=3880 RepID=A0A396J6N9_MEDTR|nr:hypothetical protein MtrunA17_Chr2g0293181 [Medicago truncatula]
MKIQFLMKVHAYKFFNPYFESNLYGREKRKKKKREKEEIRMILFLLQQKDDGDDAEKIKSI